MAEGDQKQLEKFLKELMEIERRYGNELKNAKSNRQAEVKDLVEKIVAKEAPDAD